MKKRTSMYSIITCTILAFIVALLSIGGTGLWQKVFPVQNVSQEVTPITQRVVATTMPSRNRPDLERGIATSVWTKDGYSQNNAAFQQALRDIYPQTKATWISMQVSFTQDTITSTTIQSGHPTLESFTEGIQTARKAGYHIFFEPLITVTSGSAHWGGHIQPSTLEDEKLWFQNWFLALQPYILAAQKGGVEQLAVGTELEWLQYHAPDSLWNQLLSQVHSLFTGDILYDTNWDFAQAGFPFPSWFQNPIMSVIGVSAYLPLTKSRSAIPANQATALWDTHVRQPLDRLSDTFKKPVVLSEFGYRDTSDAGYNPFEYTSSLPQDLQEQSILFNAAFTNIFSDQHIHGVFLWSWSNAARFSLAGHPALAVIAQWYSL